MVQVLEILAVAAGIVAVGAILYGSAALVRETRLVVGVLQERAAGIHARAESDTNQPV
jgi:hypothetical protein